MNIIFFFSCSSVFHTNSFYAEKYQGSPREQWYPVFLRCNNFKVKAKTSNHNTDISIVLAVVWRAESDTWRQKIRRQKWQIMQLTQKTDGQQAPTCVILKTLLYQWLQTYEDLCRLSMKPPQKLQEWIGWDIEKQGDRKQVNTAGGCVCA